MFQVLVVDDEPSAVDYICHLLRLKFPGMEIAGTAENGREGLEKYRLLHPDLVISDVKMPVMDGIAMTKAIKEEDSTVQVLVVSGYQEFEYARAALRYGVSDYILKPVTPSHFVSALEPMLHALKRRVYDQRKRLACAMIAGTAPEEAVMRRSFPGERYFVAVIRENGLPRRFTGGQGTELISDVEETIFVYGRDEREALYICPGWMTDVEGFRAMMEKEAGRKQNETHFITTVIMSDSVDTGELAHTVELLYKTLNSRLSVGVSQQLALKKGTGTETENRASEQEALEKETLSTVEYYLKKQDYSQLSDQLWRLLQQAEAIRCPQIRLERIIRKLAGMLPPMPERKNVLEDEILYEDAFYDAGNMQELYDNLKSILICHWQEEREPIRVDSVQFLEGILEFIGKHLAEELTVSYVCREFGLSQSYLNLIFRKNGIDSFNIYLRNARIQRAKQIMAQNPQIFIKDVALMVGYKDQFYFSRVFRAVTGLSPTEYVEDCCGLLRPQ